VDYDLSDGCRRWRLDLALWGRPRSELASLFLQWSPPVSGQQDSPSCEPASLPAELEAKARRTVCSGALCAVGPCGYTVQCRVHSARGASAAPSVCGRTKLNKGRPPHTSSPGKLAGRPAGTPIGLQAGPLSRSIFCPPAGPLSRRPDKVRPPSWPARNSVARPAAKWARHCCCFIGPAGRNNWKFDNSLGRLSVGRPHTHTYESGPLARLAESN